MRTNKIQHKLQYASLSPTHVTKLDEHASSNSNVYLDSNVLHISESSVDGDIFKRIRNYGNVTKVIAKNTGLDFGTDFLVYLK